MITTDVAFELAAYVWCLTLIGHFVRRIFGRTDIFITLVDFCGSFYIFFAIRTFLATRMNEDNVLLNIFLEVEPFVTEVAWKVPLPRLGEVTKAVPPLLLCCQG